MNMARRDDRRKSRERGMLLLSVVLLMVGLYGYLSLQRDAWAYYGFVHLGALGLMGLVGGAAGGLARKKSRDYWTAFALGSLIPIIAGAVAVGMYLVGEGGQLYCGGSVSLMTAVLVLVYYGLARKRTSSRAGTASRHPPM